MIWQIELLHNGKRIILVVTETTVDVQGATLIRAKPLKKLAELEQEADEN